MWEEQAGSWRKPLPKGMTEYMAGAAWLEPAFPGDTAQMEPHVKGQGDKTSIEWVPDEIKKELLGEGVPDERRFWLGKEPAEVSNTTQWVKVRPPTAPYRHEYPRYFCLRVLRNGVAGGYLCCFDDDAMWMHDGWHNHGNRQPDWRWPMVHPDKVCRRASGTSHAHRAPRTCT